jgi:hypothetical protein
MDRASREFRPNANSLESRFVMSVAALRPTLHAEILGLAAVSRPVAVAGTVRGRYSAQGEDRRAADAPLPVDLDGAGTVQGLGRVTMTGSLAFGGFLPAGAPDINGAVTLRNARGSITVRLTGSGGNSQIPGGRFRLDATIVSGTGSYANLRGIGTANAQFGRNTIRCITAPCPIGGTLTLQFNLRPPVR